MYHTKLQTALDKFQSNEDTLKDGTIVVNYILSSQLIGEDSLYKGVINDINKVSPVDNEGVTVHFANLEAHITIFFPPS